MRALLALQAVDNALHLHRLGVQGRPLSNVLVLKPSPALGALARSRHILDPIRRLGIQTPAAMPGMSGLASTLASLPLRQRRRLDRHLRGGRRGAKGAFLRLPLAQLELGFKMNDALLQAVDLLLLLEAVGTI